MVTDIEGYVRCDEAGLSATADPLFVDVTGRLLQLCNVRLINSVDFVKQTTVITAHHSAAAAAANSDYGYAGDASITA